jgi:RNA polymerase sigma factor (sigma-70 family)
MNPTYTDQQIISAIKDAPDSRDKVFTYLYQNLELRSKAFAKITKMISDQEAAEDVFTDSLIALVRAVRYNKYNGDSSLSTYFIGVCHFQCLRYIQQKQQSLRKKDMLNEGLIRQIEQEHQVDADFFLNTQRRYEARLTRRIYRQLSDTCRRYFRQKHWQGKKINEMAAENEVKNQSVKNTLSRCYKKLREIILDDPEAMEQIKLNYGKL